MKKIFFLSFLLIPATTHCMKITQFVSLYEKGQAPLSLYKSEERYDLAMALATNVPDISLALERENHHILREDLHKVNLYKSFTFNKHSFISFAAMAFNALPSRQHSEHCQETGKWTNERAPYQERKDLIKFLLQQGYRPTKNDRILAFIIEREENIPTPDNVSDLLDQMLDL